MASYGNRFSKMRNIFSRESNFGNETGSLANGEYEPSPEVLDTVKAAKVLVIGAGGLGCEILKDLALSGLTNIHVIDLDTIDVTNLNRQFLFRRKDVGRGKAEVAAEFIMNRVPECVVTPYNCKIQDKPREFYEQFSCIISGLDNIEARRWLNSMLHGITTKTIEDGEEFYEGIIPMVDGGTEGFKGQARLIIPRCTACFECTVESITPATGFAMCTIAETPRIPEHCIAYAFVSLWEKEFGKERKVDTDNPDDMKWIYEQALLRAKTYGIEGVTYFLTMGVVKNIIPAVASTNATIAAACCNEALKLITFGSQSLNCNFMIMGNEGFYTSTFEYEKKKDCIVCSADAKVVKINEEIHLRDVLQMLKDDPTYKLKDPSVSATIGPPEGRYQVNLYITGALRKATEGNLDKSLKELGLQPGDFLGITDASLFMPFNIMLDME